MDDGKERGAAMDRSLAEMQNEEAIAAKDRWEPPLSFEQLEKPLHGWVLDNIARIAVLNRPTEYRVKLLRERDGSDAQSQNSDIFLALTDARVYAQNIERREENERNI